MNETPSNALHSGVLLLRLVPFLAKRKLQEKENRRGQK